MAGWHLDTEETRQIHEELEAVRLARQASIDVMERQRLRNRQGELTQQYWRLFWDSRRGK